VKTLGAGVNKANANGRSPLLFAAENGDLKLVQCMLKDLGADVIQESAYGTTPVMVAAYYGYLAVVRCLARDHGADINQAREDGITTLILAAQNGRLDIVQCLVVDLGADINQSAHNGDTPLIMALYGKQDKVVKWLLKHGADAQATTVGGTAVDASRAAKAPIAQTQYLEVKAHCSNPGCSGAGLKKCTGCKQVRYCGQVCQLAHWKAHKGECEARKSE
jgi:ankyrin repeat protein